MMGHKEKLLSFIKFTKTEMTSIPCLVNEFEDFMESEFEDAETY